MKKDVKKVNVNCGKAIILNKNLGELESFDGGTINTGSLLASQEAYVSLLEKGFSINAGDTSILNITGKPMLFEKGEQALQGGKEGLKGCLVVIEDDLIIPPQGTDAFSQVEGLYVTGILYYPEGFSLETISGLRANAVEPYPEYAHFIKEKEFALTEDVFIKLEKETMYYVRGKVVLIDPSLANIQDSRGIGFVAEKLTIREEYLSLFDKIQAKKQVVIPKGHELAENLTLTATSPLIYGDKIYVKGDLVVQPKGVTVLDELSSIIVEKTAKLTLEALPFFKKIGKAKGIKVFEGELKEVQGTMDYSHDALQAAAQAGLYHSIFVDGVLRFEEDVQPEDLDVVQAIRCNGIIFAPKKLMALIQQKTEELNGQLLPLQTLTENGWNDNHLLEEKTNDANINTGRFVII